MCVKIKFSFQTSEESKEVTESEPTEVREETEESEKSGDGLKEEEKNDTAEKNEEDGEEMGESINENGDVAETEKDPHENNLNTEEEGNPPGGKNESMKQDANNNEAEE